MSITATVKNGAIELPPGLHLPDGTRVRIETEKPGDGASLDWMHEFAGSVSGPSDLAAEHDHYARGTPKRTER
jgi:hypothetical protein